MNASTIRPVFSDSEPLDEAPARPLRPSGFVALLLGGLSFVAIFSQDLFFVPLAAILLGLFAMRPARRSAEKPYRGIAGLGIVLALFFGSWAFTYFRVQSSELTSTAVPFALNWLEIVRRGGVANALELSKPVGNRLMEDVSPTEYYSQGSLEVSIDYDNFRNGRLVKALSSADTKPVWKLARSARFEPYGGEEAIVLVFEDTTQNLSPIRLVLSRQFPYGAEGIDPDAPKQWYVLSSGFID